MSRRHKRAAHGDHHVARLVGEERDCSALKNDKWPEETVARETWLREARGLRQRCVLPELDVLLPRESCSAEGERFFVAAFADEKAASALADRIRQQLKRLRHVEQTGWTLSVSYRMLHAVQADAGATRDDLVASMAGILDEAVTSHISSEAVVS